MFFMYFIENHVETSMGRAMVSLYQIKFFNCVDLMIQIVHNKLQHSSSGNSGDRIEEDIKIWIRKYVSTNRKPPLCEPVNFALRILRQDYVVEEALLKAT